MNNPIKEIAIQHCYMDQWKVLTVSTLKETSKEKVDKK